MKIYDVLLEGAWSLTKAEPMKDSDVKVSDAGGGKLLVSVTPTAGPLINFMRSLVFNLQRKKGYVVAMKSGIELPRWDKFKANAFQVVKYPSKDELKAIIATSVKAHNNSITKEKQAIARANSPEQKKKDAEFRSQQTKSRKEKLEQEYGKGTWDRVKIRQVGGDDGYQWTLFVDGQERMNGMTKSSAESAQENAADEIAKKEKLGKYARQEKAYNKFKKKVGLPSKEEHAPVALDADFIKKVESPIYRTWERISPDAGRVSSKDAMELVLDADRMVGGPDKAANSEAYKLIMAAIDQHGFDKTFKFLTSKIRL
jgi:hypothetical protein